ncbi:unknown [Sutterella wadsworthensis CAG:135]|nr:unknown [Sutterella wadsworthensis CAG:135]
MLDRAHIPGRVLHLDSKLLKEREGVARGVDAVGDFRHMLTEILERILEIFRSGTRVRSGIGELLQLFRGNADALTHLVKRVARTREVRHRLLKAEAHRAG